MGSTFSSVKITSTSEGVRVAKVGKAKQGPAYYNQKNYVEFYNLQNVPSLQAFLPVK